MNIKSVVKVMNFHSLLRVDSSRKRAEKYGTLLSELESMMSIILNNRNIKLDKILVVPPEDAPVLRIYIGSDYGFCGSVNTGLDSVLAQDKDSEKIVIGKKIKNTKNVSLYIYQDELSERLPDVEKYLMDAVYEGKYSAVDLVYNHYYNMSTIRQVQRRIYPLELKEGSDADTRGDFVMEGEPRELLNEMLRYYLFLQLKISHVSAYASENIIRQNTTSESLKKLDEIEETERLMARKARNQESFRKTIDSYSKQKAFEKAK